MATVYIAPTAQGSADGTSAANAYAYSSLSSAETDAGAGGTILFTDGDYSLTGTITWSGVGSSGNNITYKSENLQKAVIKSNTGGTLRELNLGNTGNTSTLNLQNFKFIDIHFYIRNHGAGEVSGNLITTSTAVTIPTSGFLRVKDTGTTKFINNIINFQYNSGNYFENSTGKLAEFSGNTLYISNLSGKSAFYFSYTASADLRSCAVVKNNIFTSDDTTGAVINTQNSFSGSSNNSCWFQFDDSENGSGGTNNVFTDPLFVDSTNDDFRLRPSSPCINAGA